MSVFNAYMQLSGAIDADVYRDEPLSRRTTLRIGGPADLLVVAHSYTALAHTLDVLAHERVTHTLPTDDALWRDFVWMTPLNQDLSDEEKNAIAARNGGSVTVDLYVTACRLRGRA